MIGSRSFKKAAILCLVIKLSTGNVALNKPAYASTNYPYGNSDPGNVIDGNHDALWEGGSCFLTAPHDWDPWWMVDLLSDYTIHNITIRNRAEVYTDRLHDFKIEVFKTNPVRCPTAVVQHCFQYNGHFGSLETLTCDSVVTGRFVKLTKFKMNHHADNFCLCEVEIEALENAKQGYQWIRYPRNPDVKLNQLSAQTPETLKMNECACACARNTSCVGFNYGRTTETCQMVVRPTADDSLVADAAVDW